MVQRDATVAEAVRAMTAHNVGIVNVLDGDRLVGVFSERDVVCRVVDRGLDPTRTPVGDVMTTALVVADDGKGIGTVPRPTALLARGKLGLLGIQERVRLGHGTLDIGARPGGGTKVSVRVPADVPATTA